MKTVFDGRWAIRESKLVNVAFKVDTGLSDSKKFRVVEHFNVHFIEGNNDAETVAGMRALFKMLYKKSGKIGRAYLKWRRRELVALSKLRVQLDNKAPVRKAKLTFD